MEIAGRIKALREICEISVEDIASDVELTPDEYLEMESGSRDLPIGFLCKVAEKLSVDVNELLTGVSPKLTVFAMTKSDHGVSVSRNPQYKYQSLAYNFLHKHIEPFLVTVDPLPEDAPVALNGHTGQEFDYVVSGAIKFIIEDKEVLLNEGDCIYLDASHIHGIKAVGDKPAKFLAIVLD
jgi:mannose-6-phosphate isomerase-like protein (cupin superfamily)/DNA-binding XRE family transcriptional regulator